MLKIALFSAFFIGIYGENVEKIFLVDLMANLEVKNLIILDEWFQKKFAEKNTFDLMKFQSSFNIFSISMNANELGYVMTAYKDLGLQNSKIAVFIKTSNLRAVASNIFRIRNEAFTPNFIWVLFDSPEMDHDELDFMYIPYSCQFLLIKSTNHTNFEINELYNTQAFTKERYITYFGKWDQTNGIQPRGTDFYHRRFEMNRTELGVVAKYVPRKCNHPTICEYEKIVAELARMMNFIPYYGTFEDMERLLKNDSSIVLEIYISPFIFDIDHFRYEVVAPIWKTPAFLHIKFINKYEQGDENPYRRPFTTKVWLSIVISAAVCTIIVIYVDFFVQKMKSRRFTFTDAAFLPLDSISTQCGSDIPAVISSRIAALASRLNPLFLVPAYSAAIVSFLTVRYIQLPFNDLNSLVKDGTFKTGYQNETLLKVFFDNRNDDISKLVKTKFMVGPEDMPMSLRGSITKMCNDPKFAYIGFNNDVFLMKERCRIIQIPAPVFTTWDAFMLRNRSPYRAIFNRILKTFYSSGVLRKMEKIAYGEKPTYEENNSQEPVAIESVERIYAIFSVIYAVSIILLSMERLHFQRYFAGLHNLYFFNSAKAQNKF